MDRVGKDRGWLHPHLEATQVLRLDDRPPVVPEMAESIVEEEQHFDVGALLKLLVETVADLPIKYLVGVVIAADEVRNQKHAHIRKHRRRAAAGVADGDIARLNRVHYL